MGDTGDPRSSATTECDGSAPLNLGDHTLLELLRSGDPVIIEAAERLLAQRMEHKEQVLLGWHSYLETDPRSDR